MEKKLFKVWIRQTIPGTGPFSLRHRVVCVEATGKSLVVEKIIEKEQGKMQLPEEELEIIKIFE